MSAAWESFARLIREGDKDIAGTDFLGSKPTPEQQAIMDSWEDPRGPEYSKEARMQRAIAEMRKGPWYTNKVNVYVLASFAFIVGLMFGTIIII